MTISNAAHLKYVTSQAECERSATARLEVSYHTTMSFVSAKEEDTGKTMYKSQCTKETIASQTTTFWWRMRDFTSENESHLSPKQNTVAWVILFWIWNRIWSSRDILLGFHRNSNCICFTLTCEENSIWNIDIQLDFYRFNWMYHLITSPTGIKVFRVEKRN